LAAASDGASRPRGSGARRAARSRPPPHDAARASSSSAVRRRRHPGTEAPSLAAANTLLYLDGVTVSFDGFKALNALSLIVEKASCAPSSARTAPARRR